MQDLLRLLATSVAALALMAGPAFAQPPADESAEDGAADDEELDDEELDDDEDLDEEEDEGLDEPQLRPPQLEMPDVSTGGDDDEVDPEEAELAADDEEEDDDDDDDVDPESDMDLLSAAEPPPSSDPTLSRWTAPRSVVTLNGYFRTRGELWDNFFLGRGFRGSTTTTEGAIFDPEDAPFTRFVPADRIAATRSACSTIDASRTPCRNSDRLRFANMRLRLRPTIALSDDVKVHMMIDAFDNLVLGSTPNSQTYQLDSVGDSETDRFRRPGSNPQVPLDTFASTQDPSQANRNSARDAIYVRRAWAEVTNRGIGQLRFGRMGDHWGLGMMNNGGDGIDGDFSSDVDRIMLITKLAGFHFFGAYDFALQGITNQLVTDARDVPFDLTAKDDIRQYVVGVARRTEDEEARARLQRGSWVLEGGLRFAYRSQSFSTSMVGSAYPTHTDYQLVERDARMFVPDLWGRFRMGGLRLEVEAATVIGDIGNIGNELTIGESRDIRQFGIAFEGEYRLLDDKLTIRLYTGYATGDAEVNGLSWRDGLITQEPPVADDTISTFAFHPNYRIDLILWRNIMQRFAGAWYLKPGLSYDIIKNPFGQIFGIRADAIYSRAAQEVQTYGSDPNLGLELNFSLYYRSEDGPDLLDGFYASFQYGVLFPFDGLGYVDGDSRADEFDIGNAQALRLILGVQY